MPKFQVILQRERYDYASVEIEAQDEYDAQTKVDKMMENGWFPDDWESGDTSGEWETSETLCIDENRNPNISLELSDTPLPECGFGT